MARRLIVLSTGGTIAMAAAAPEAGGDLRFNAHALIEAAPGLDALARIEARDVLAKPSASFTLADQAKIARAAEEAAREADGVVVTHGTDTLEETAFALSLLTRVDAPIVLTGAMRRPDQPGADGPANLLAAARVALCEQARALGPLVVMDDEIFCAHLVRKSHSFRPHAFSAHPFGPIGHVAEGRVRIVLKPAALPPQISFGAGSARVAILEAGAGFCAETALALATVVDGLVLSLPGAGHVAADAAPALGELAQRLPVVFATRTGAGETLASSYAYAGGEIDLIARGLIPAGPLDARKARVALQLLLSDGADRARVGACFAMFSAT
ncbi:asparaginase [Methylocella sp.]|uniref:asparaginase n=1 Tax=Methylocella sp. TaxID=1978226 RepID=UPI0037851BC0